MGLPLPALERIIRANLATDPDRRDASAAAFVARLRRWWGADLPTSRVTLLLTDGGEASVDEVARAHRGHCLAPADGGPSVAAFTSADDGLDAAHELAPLLDARLVAVTGGAEPRAGGYRGELPSRAAGLLAAVAEGRVLVDDATAEALEGRLAPEIGLAQLAEPTPTGGRAWALVAPDLPIPSRAGPCPYRGLMAFGAEDGDLFFGREAVVAGVLDRLAEGGFMAVVGASGSGKSSLVRAGLVPAFRRASNGAVAIMTPGADPPAELARALAAGPPSLLVVDQLEELFTLCGDEGSRARFVDALMDLRETTSTSEWSSCGRTSTGAAPTTPASPRRWRSPSSCSGPCGARSSGGRSRARPAPRACGSRRG